MIEWRIIPGFEKYEISEFGDVRRLRDSARGPKSGDIVNGWVSKIGYRQVTLTPGDAVGKRFLRKQYVHTLVALAFIGERPVNKKEVAHNDGNKLNNHYTNLRWATSRENASDRLAHGTILRGIRHPGAKLSEAIVLAARKRHSEGIITIQALADETGVCWEVMNRAISGRTWAHVPKPEK